MKIRKQINPEHFFLILLVSFGILIVFITPLGAGFDEDTHIARIWEMSKGVFIPNQYLSTGPNYPSAFYQLSYRQDVNLEPVAWSGFVNYFKTKINWNNFINYQTRSIYFPTLYLIQAFIIGILGRVFDSSVGTIYFSIRLSYLMEYLALCFIAIKIIPRGKWLLGFITIWPMSIIQATIISPDGISNAICFLFLAWIFYLRELPGNPTRISTTRSYLITMMMICALLTVKLNCLPFLLLLILIPKQVFTKRQSIILGVFLIVTVLLLVIGWNFLVSNNMGVIGSKISSPLDRIIGALENPLDLLKTISLDFGQNSPRYFRELIGVSGYDYWKLPRFSYYLFPILLVTIGLLDAKPLVSNWRQRVLLIITSLGIVLFTSTIFYLLYSTDGSQVISGIQGRYYLIAIPLLFYGIQMTPREITFLDKLVQTFSVGGILITTISLFLSYHFICGNSWYQNEKCFLPRYKNWDPITLEKISAVEISSLSQTFIPRCDNSNQIALWSSGNGVTEIPIKIINTTTNDIVEETFFVNSLNEVPQWNYINLRENQVTKNNRYSIEFDFRNREGQTPSYFYYSTTNEYKEGELTINSQMYPGDLVFQYGCEDHYLK